MHMDMMDNTFMLAGPVKLHPRVLQAMSHPSIAHRSPEFAEVLLEVRDLLKYLFQADRPVAVISGSGTAGVESAVAGLIGKGDRMLSLDNGKFGERVGGIAKVFGETKTIGAPWGTHFDLDAVAAELETGAYRAIALCHNETSTAMTNDAMAIGRLAKKNDVLFLLDGITSVGGLDVRPREMNADIVVFGSQKCIGAPAGLSAVSVSDALLEELRTDNAYYLNLKKHIAKLDEGSTPYTPAIHLLMGFREALRMVKEDGLQNRIAGYAAMADATRAAASALGLRLYPDPHYASNTVSGFWLPEGVGDKQVRGALKDKYSVIVAGAQDAIKGKVFRIGHMGLANWTELVATFGAIEAVLLQNGYSFEVGTGVAEVIRRMP